MVTAVLGAADADARPDAQVVSHSTGDRLRKDVVAVDVDRSAGRTASTQR